LDIKGKHSASKRLRKLNANRRELVSEQAKELKRIKNSHLKERDRIKVKNQQDIINLRERRKKGLQEIIVDYDQKLEGQRNILKKEQIRLEKQKNELIEGHKKNITTINENHNTKHQSKFVDFKEKSEDLEFGTNLAMIKAKKINEEAIAAQQIDHKNIFEHKKLDHRRLIQKQRNANISHLRGKEYTFDRDKFKQQSDHKRIMATLQINLEKKFIEREQAFQKNLSHQIKYHQSLLNEDKATFNKRYLNQKKEHEIFINRLKGKFKENMAHLAKTNSIEKKHFDERFSDPFYKTRTISPEVHEQKNHYLVSIKIPPFEKENVNFNARGRKITVSLTRNYTGEASMKDDNSINKSSVHEAVTKIINLKDIIDPTSIKQKYENGILSFIIKKA